MNLRFPSFWGTKKRYDRTLENIQNFTLIFLPTPTIYFIFFVIFGLFWGRAQNWVMTEVLCDVVLIQASHILLRWPWQYDKKGIHDGVKNRYTTVKDGKIISFAPLTPKQVYNDQIKLKSEHQVTGRENLGEEQGERRPSDSARAQTTITDSNTHPNTNKY